MAPRSSAKRSYRKRVRSSPCRGKGRTTCRATKRCKYTSGKKRSFCRKVKNTKRHTMRRRSRKGAAMRRRIVGGLWDPGPNLRPDASHGPSSPIGGIVVVQCFLLLLMLFQNLMII